MSSIKSPENEANVLQVLMGLYEQLIARDTSLIQTIFLITGAGVTVATFSVLELPRYSPTGMTKGIHNPWFYVGVPLVPTIFIGLLIFLTLHIQFLAQYGHAVEMRISEITGGHLSERELGISGFSADIPTFMRLSSKLFGSGSIRLTRIYRVSALITLVAVASLLVGIASYILIPLPPLINLVVVLIYLPVNLCIAVVLVQSLRPNRRLLADALNATSPEPGKRPKRSERTLLSYLIVPRVSDHLAKIAIGIVGILIGDLAYHYLAHAPIISFDLTWALLLYVGVFEYLFYQARYSWNDVRGAGDDDKHVYAKERKRIPLPLTRRRLSAVLCSALLKIVIGVFVVVAFAPGWSKPPLLIGLLAVITSSLLYESFRSRAAIGAGHVLTRPAIAGVFTTVGSGYAIRISVGILIMDHGTIAWTIVALFALSMWAFEIATVSISWVFEGLQFVPGWVSGTSSSTYSARLDSKSHVLVLLEEANILEKNSRSVDVELEPGKSLIESKALITKGKWVFSVWTAFGALAFVAMSIAALYVAEGFNSRNLGAVITVLIISFICSVAWFRPEYTLVGAGIGVLLLAVVGAIDSLPYTAFACVIIAGFSAFYNLALHGNYKFIINWVTDMGASFKAAMKKLSEKLRPFAHWLLGEKFFEPDPHEESAVEQAMEQTRHYVRRTVSNDSRTNSDPASGFDEMA